MTRVPIAIIGRSCRLPGAPDVDSFWALLSEGRCAVTSVDPARWAQRRYLHPRKGEAGKSYTFAAGVLPDVFGFDPSVFSISPREAEQMDPQQRLALMLVWEALEDAGIPASQLAGTETGVFVGASSFDYSQRATYDSASVDPYFMLGNTLSIVSNRISYAFDLRGPSFTVDTACSSSLVALNEAAAAIDAGRIDTAVVVGVNVLTSPGPFIGFAQASMLSPTGLCKAFDASADGYVRAEGGVAIIIRRADAAQASGNRVYARLLGTGVNSDGRTIGMSLPSSEAQADLLRRIYGEAEIDAESLAFVEAHGTGTRVGDPAEARAVGSVLAAGRSEPLPIGSAKSNVGHLEPAAGLVGTLKAMLALEHDLLPPTLHIRSLNPDIPFDALNLAVAREAVPLRNGGVPRAAGVNSFGFGGTNAHAVVADPEPGDKVTPLAKTLNGERPVLAISARSREALIALAARYSDLLADKSEQEAATVAASVARSRDLLSHRLVVEGNDPNFWAARLASVAAGEETEGVVLDSAIAREAPVAFMYSGNGSQWAGMGRAFRQISPAYRERLAEIDGLFARLAGWSVADALGADDLPEKLKRAEYAQPLLFATQMATTAALEEAGVVPAMVLGHSVGEVAAAAASGALALEDAVNVIHKRSHHQEIAWKAGTMAAVLLPLEEAKALIAEGGFAGVEIAAVNSARSLTVSGPEPEIKALAKLARTRRVPMRVLDLDYPFHTALIEGVRGPLLADLADLTPAETFIPFVSSVTGKLAAGRDLDADYWWRNVREPVHFADAAATALAKGARVFLEIGPRPVLQTYAGDALAAAEISGAVISCDDHNLPQGVDPARRALARVLAKGGAVDRARVFGTARGAPERLPSYPWQNRDFLFPVSGESFQLFSDEGHMLLGARNRADSAEWNGHLDTHLVPFLADHKVGGRVVLPAAAMLEMALSAGRRWLGTETVELQDFEIPRALVLDQEVLREVKVRISPESRTVEILSRPRLREEQWTLHAYGRVAAIPTRAEPLAMPFVGEATEAVSADDLYALAFRHGLDYGPSFRAARRVERLGETTIRVDIEGETADSLAVAGFGIGPAALDAAFHGLFILFGRGGARADVAYLPMRFGEVRLHRPGVPVTTARIDVKRVSPRTIRASFSLLAEDGSVVLSMDDCRFRSAVLARRASFDRLGYHYGYEQLAPAVDAPAAAAPTLRSLHEAAVRADAAAKAPLPRSDDDLLLEAYAVAVAHKAMVRLAGQRRKFSTDDLVGVGHLAASSVPLANRLLQMLEERGHARAHGERWSISRKADLPPPAAILRTIVSEHPTRGAEAILAARAAALLPRILAEGPSAEQPFGSSTLAQYFAASPAAEALADGVSALVDEILTGWPADRPLRVLEIGAGAGALTRRLVGHGSDPRVSITVTDPDETATERLRFAFGHRPGVRIQPLDLSAADAPELAPFDLVVSAAPLAHALPDHAALQRVNRLVAEGGVIAVAALAPGAFPDVIFGLRADWFARSVAPEFPVGRLRSADDWVADLREARLGDSEAVPLATAAASALLVLAAARRRPAEEPAAEKAGPVVLVCDGTAACQSLAKALARQFEAAGRTVTLVDGEAGKRNGNGASKAAAWGEARPLGVELAKGAAEGKQAADIVDLAGLVLDGSGATAAITARIGLTLGLARSINEKAARLWVVAPGALQGVAEGGADRPEQAAIGGFLRVLKNETRGLDLRLLDIAPDLSTDVAAAAIAREIMAPRADTELVVSASGTFAPRLRHGIPPAPERRAPPLRSRAVKLVPGRDGGIDDLAWEEAPIRVPRRGEVVIDIAAAGLNFRDVMWSLGLLPEEALEDGFAGPEIGIEGAGTVVAVGQGVRRFKPGDRVLTFASGSFASRVVVPEVAVAPMPARLSFEAGATIPVTFLTAYYSLHHLARLRRKEWLLIHGGAGGVGLAALQIARWRGAKTIVTAGSEEKREFLRMLGADHALSSRSLDFIDQVKELTDGEGVDVVLNSLSGEAMERSLQVTRPFGRFLELGKRDFYANSRIGLRPFRRNVSYFGIDADQLLMHKRHLTERLFGDIVTQFEKGVFAALPYRAFGATEVKDAFRLMQQSGHVGKIVVAPPKVEEVGTGAEPEFRADPDGTHLVVGGLGGFGLALADWLVRRGARNLVLVGRSGASTPEAKEAMARLARLGVRVRAPACDAADPKALAAVIEDVRRTLPPLKGVIHAAMVLDDTLIESLDASRVEKVLRPKVDGAANLDRLTRGDRLDYFVLFSSATTVIGNPGQANYVAANAYLESLARKRRAERLPGLAIAWGALEDVGYLAREAAVREKLARKLGQAGITAAEALDALGRLLAESDATDRVASTIVIAPIDWASARRELRLLGSPVFAQVISDADAGGADAGERVNLSAVVKGRDPRQAREAVAEILVGEVARILKLPAKEIGPQRPLAELGMDSLMGLELRMSIERRFGIELPLVAISDTTTLTSIAGTIVSRVQDPDAGEAEAEGEAADPTAELVRRHVSDTVQSDDLSKIEQAVRTRRAEAGRIN